MDTLISTTALNGRLLDSRGEQDMVPVMPLTPEQLAEQALDLPTESRARLADLLVESLDAAELGPLDRAWAAEARERLEDIRSGAVTPLPAEEVFRKVRDSLQR